MKQKSILYVVIIILYIALSYSVFLIFNKETVRLLVEEDSLFESLTALFFLVASIGFAVKYLQGKSGNDFILLKTRKNLFFLVLAIIFFMGFGEEISWGQRIFKFKTPEVLEDINVQREFNVHNITIFNVRSFDGTNKEGVARFLTMSRLYNLFWLIYGILIPVANRLSFRCAGWLKRVNLPIIPIWIGSFFMVNYLIYKLTLLVFPGEFLSGEIKECTYAFLFMLASIYLYRNVDGRLTG